MMTKTTISDIPHVLHSIRLSAVPRVVSLGHFPHKNPVIYHFSKAEKIYKHIMRYGSTYINAKVFQQKSSRIFMIR